MVETCYSRAKGRNVTTITRQELEELSAVQSYNFASRILYCSGYMLRRYVKTYHPDLHEKFTTNGVTIRRSNKKENIKCE